MCAMPPIDVPTPNDSEVGSFFMRAIRSWMSLIGNSVRTAKTRYSENNSWNGVKSR